MIAASYAGCEEILAVSLLTISIAGQGFNTGGTILNGFDLGPNYIGPLSGMVAGVSTISSLMAPYIVGLLTPHVSKCLKNTAFYPSVRCIQTFTSSISAGIHVGVASCILADIYFAHVEDDNIHNLGLRKSSTMELTANVYQKYLLNPSYIHTMYLFIYLFIYFD